MSVISPSLQRGSKTVLRRRMLLLLFLAAAMAVFVVILASKQPLRPSVFKGNITTLGSLGGRPVVDITVVAGEIPHDLTQHALTFVTTPSDPSLFSSGAPLSAALSAGKFYGYKYSSKNASDETTQRGLNHPPSFAHSRLFPGTFFASDSELAHPSVDFQSFIGVHGDLTLHPLSDITLQSDSRYIIIADEDGIVLTVRGLTWCGDAVKTAGETCSSCPADVTCASNELCAQGICVRSQCSDGIDNDGDGLKDTKDPGCFSDGPREPGMSYPHGNAVTGMYDPMKNDETHEPWCPNGAIDLPFEQCDDGNFVSTDRCKSDCTPAVCGDGIVQKPNAQGVMEVCDNGPLNGQFGYCDAMCRQPPLPSNCIFPVPGKVITGGTPSVCLASGFGKTPLPSDVRLGELMDLDMDEKIDIVSIGDSILTYINQGNMVFRQMYMGSALEELRARHLIMAMFVQQDPVGQQNLIGQMQASILCLQQKLQPSQTDLQLLGRYGIVLSFMQMDSQAQGMELTTMEHDITNLEAAAVGITTGIGFFPVARSYDLDGDGNMDLLIQSNSRNGDMISTNLTKCMNNGGAFTCASASGMAWPWFTALQLDGDSQLEIVVPELDRVVYFDVLGGARSPFQLSGIPFGGGTIAGLTTFNASAVGDKLFNGSAIFDAHQTCMLTGSPGGQAGCAAPSQGTEDLIRVGDFNGDGRDDFLAVVSVNGGMDLNLQLNGVSTVGRVPGPASSFTGGRATWIEPMDMDNDGDLDIAGVAQTAMGTSGGVQTVFWLENKGGNLSWVEHVIDQGDLGINVTGKTFRVADLDGDHLPDLFAPGMKGVIYTRSCNH